MEIDIRDETSLISTRPLGSSRNLPFSRGGEELRDKPKERLRTEEDSQLSHYTKIT